MPFRGYIYLFMMQSYTKYTNKKKIARIVKTQWYNVTHTLSYHHMSFAVKQSGSNISPSHYIMHSLKDQPLVSVCQDYD